MIIDGTNREPDLLIDYFDAFDGDNPYGFLSNFAATPVTGQVTGWGAFTYATAEHAYQAAKARRAVDHDRVRSADTPGNAKAMGRHVDLRRDWERVKYGVMANVIAAKFNGHQGDVLSGLLVGTGHALLVEGTWWGDEVWGVDLARSRPPHSEHVVPPGENWLGRLLMVRRAALRRIVGVDPIDPRRFDYRTVCGTLPGRRR